MATPPLKTEISDTYPNPTNAVARAGFAKLYDYVTGLLGSTGNAPEARAALGVPNIAGDTFTGLMKFKTGTSVTSATTIDLSTATGNTVHITGTTAISAVTMSNGQIMDVVFDDILILTHNSTTNKLPSGADITTSAGDTARYFYDGVVVYCLSYTKANGQAVVGTAPLIATLSEVIARTNNTKMITPLGLQGFLVSGNPIITTSGTEKTIAGIPDWVKRITISLDGVSLSGSANFKLYLGISSGIDTSGYLSSTAFLGGSNTVTAGTSGFGLSTASAAADIASGTVLLTLLDKTTNTWALSSQLTRYSNPGIHISSGSKSLSGALDRIQLTTTNGTDTFDAGQFNILYE